MLHEVDEVAVKVFQGYVGQQGQDLLLKEISILRSCRNKNIVQFFGVAFQGEDIWMLMELMEGNLARHLARGHHCTWYFRCGPRLTDDQRASEKLPFSQPGVNLTIFGVSAGTDRERCPFHL